MADPTPPPAPAQPVVVVDSAGNAYTVAPEELAQAQAAGYARPTPEQLAGIEAQQKFGGVSGGAKAFAAGVGRGLTFGTSDLALTRSGLVAPGTLKGLEETNPTASGAGHVAGALLPLLATDGAAAGAEGGLAATEGLEGLGAAAAGDAGFGAASQPSALQQAIRALAAPQRAVSKLGDLASGAAAGESPGLLQQALGGAVRGAVETPFYSAGDQLSEDVLDNKPLTAESLLEAGANGMVLGALGGGAIEGGIGLAKRYVPAVFEKTTAALNRLSDKTKVIAPDSAGDLRALGSSLETADKGMQEIAARVSGEDKGAAVDALLGKSAAAAPKLDAALDQIAAPYVRPAFDATPALAQAQAHVQGIQDGVADLERRFYREYKPQEVKRLIGAEAPSQVPMRAVAEIRQTLEEAQFQGSAYGMAGDLLATAEDQAANASSLADQHIALDRLKRGIDAVRSPVLETPRERLVYEKLVEARRKLKDLLVDEDVFGPAAQFQKEVNALDSARRESYKGYRKALLRNSASSDEFGHVAASDKVARFAAGQDAGKFQFGDAIKHVQAYARDAGAFSRRLSGLIPDTAASTEAAQLAVAAERMPAVLKDAGAAVGKAKLLSKSPLEFGGSASRDAGRLLDKLRDQVDGAATDAERFKRIEATYRNLVNAKKLRPGLAELRDKLEGLLTDQGIFGAAAAHHVELDGALKAYQGARQDLHDVLFAKKFPDRADPSKLHTLVGRLARGDERADLVQAALDAHEEAARELIDVADRGTYQKIGRKNVDLAEVGKHLGALGGAKDAATASMREQVESNAAKHGEFVHIPGIPGAIKEPLQGTGGLGVLAIAHMLGVPTPLVIGAGVGLAGRAIARGAKSEAISALARQTAKVTEKISRGLDAALTNARGKAINIAAPAMGWLAQQPRSPAAVHEAWLHHLAELDKYKGNPDGQAEQLARFTGGIQSHAPAVAGQLQQAVLVREAYLSQFAPRSKLPPGPFTKAYPYTPSPTELARYTRVHRAVTQPLSLLEDLRANQVTPEAVAAVKATSPALYAEMGRQLVDKLTEPDTHLDYQQRLSIGLFLGQPADYAQQMVARQQDMYAAAAAQKKTPTEGSPRLGALKGVPGRSATTFSGAENV